jgi:hypothetical protein
MVSGLELFPEVSPSSEWCQRWDGGSHTWRHRRGVEFEPGRYEVAPLSPTAAKRYVLANHYASTFVAAKRCYGLFEGKALVGAAVLSIPVQEKVLTNVFPGLEPYQESLELGRLVLADRVPANGESWFLARAFRLAAEEGVRGVVAFSDPVPRKVGGEVLFPGHVGWIYQALNASYCGRATARKLWVLPDGSSVNDRSLQKVRKGERGHEHVERRLMALGATVRRAGVSGAAWLPEALEQAGAVRMAHGGNHRYAFAIGPARRRRSPVSEGPYPKAVDAA